MNTPLDLPPPPPPPPSGSWLRRIQAVILRRWRHRGGIIRVYLDDLPKTGGQRDIV